MYLKFNPFKSLTVAGAVVGIGVGVLFPHFNPDALGPTAQLVLQSFGGILSVVGIRNAVAKSVADIVVTLAQKRGGV